MSNVFEVLAGVVDKMEPPRDPAELVARRALQLLAVLGPVGDPVTRAAEQYAGHLADALAIWKARTGHLADALPASTAQVVTFPIPDTEFGGRYVYCPATIATPAILRKETKEAKTGKWSVVNAYHSGPT